MLLLGMTNIRPELIMGGFEKDGGMDYFNDFWCFGTIIFGMGDLGTRAVAHEDCWKNRIFRCFNYMCNRKAKKVSPRI